MDSLREPRGVRAFLRFGLGAILLATATGKLADLPGFVDVLRTYRAFADAALLPIALGVSAGELALAIWLFSGRRLFAAAITSIVMHAVYSGWSAASVLRGLRLENCGCFGVFLKRPLGWPTVAEDLALVGLSAALAGLSRRASG